MFQLGFCNKKKSEVFEMLTDKVTFLGFYWP